MSFLIGLLMVIVGAFIAGVSPWPYKVHKTYKMEHTLLLSQIGGMFLVPWIIMFCVCDAGETFRLIGWQNIIYANIFSLFFGIANILAIICLVKIGFVMNSVLGGGTALVVATLTPLIFKGSGIFFNAPDINSPAGIISIIAVLVMVAAIIVISKSGEMRDLQLGRKGVCEELTAFQNNFYRILCVISGVMAPGLLFLNTYFGPILSNAAKTAGCAEELSGLSLWTFGMIGCVFVNVLYTIIVICKNKSFNKFLNFKEFLGSVCSGVQYIAYLIIFAFATVLMGALGAVIGNGVSQCVCTGGQQFIGFAFGEWKGVKGKPIKVFCIGIVLLVLGIVLLTVGSLLNK